MRETLIEALVRAFIHSFLAYSGLPSLWSQIRLLCKKAAGFIEICKFQLSLQNLQKTLVLDRAAPLSVLWSG